MALRREASHAGSWYDDRETTLNGQLDGWLAQVRPQAIPQPPLSVIDIDVKAPASSSSSSSSAAAALSMPVAGCKAVIAPHAGYAYSGPAAAWAYKCIDATKHKRIFVLGPSHHVYIDGCALSACQTYSTPVGDLPLDRDTIAELKATGEFARDMSISTDEDEHSIEMHLPYIRKVFEDQDVKVVPILVGAISAAKEEKFGKLLAPYLADPETFFVVSSDFCHWGSRFGYTYYRPDLESTARDLLKTEKLGAAQPRIHASIRALDGTAIRHLTFPANLPQPDARDFTTAGTGRAADAPLGGTDDADTHDRTAKMAMTEFTKYLRETRNTICGRHPIGVLLGALAHLESQGTRSELRFTRYEQSSECLSVRDSSVSYGSAFVRFLGS